MENQKTESSLIKRLLDGTATLATVLSGMSMVLLISSFGWLVFGRYVLNDTPTWVEQLAILLITTITFLSAAVGVHYRTHLSVEFLAYCLPQKGVVMLDIIIDLIMAVFGFAMAYYVCELASFAWYRVIPLLGISDGYRYFPVIASGAMIGLFSLYRLALGINTLVKNPAAPSSTAMKEN